MAEPQPRKPAAGAAQMLARVGSRTPGAAVPKTGYALNMTALLDGLGDATLISSLAQHILEHNSTQAEALAAKQPSALHTSREAEYLVNQGAAVRLETIRGGHVSAWKVPRLLNKCIQEQSVEGLVAIVEHVKDLREMDIAKVLLFALSQADLGTAELLQRVLRLPFRRFMMAAYLKSFGTAQVLALLDVLVGLLPSARADLALTWASLLIDTHYTLLAVQPVFLPVLKQLHETVAEALHEDEMAEGVAGAVRALVACRIDASRGGALQSGALTVVTPDYFVERSVEL